MNVILLFQYLTVITTTALLGIIYQNQMLQMGNFLLFKQWWNACIENKNTFCNKIPPILYLFLVKEPMV